jgi:hypothetical protein
MMCECQDTHPKGANYYVSVVDGLDRRRIGLLLGPFKRHDEALKKVEAVRRKAEELDPKAVFYSFGTVAMRPEYTKPGVLNGFMA